MLLRTPSGALLLCLSLLATSSAAASIEPQEPLVGPPSTVPERDPAEAALLSALHEGRAAGHDLGELPVELVEQAAGALRAEPELMDLGLQLLTDRRVPAQGEAPEQVMSLVQEELLLAGYAEAPGLAAQAARDRYLTRVRKEARDVDPEAPVDPAAAEALLLVTGALGRSGDMQLVFDLAPELPLPGGAFERTLVRLLRADPRAFERLRENWLGGSELCLTASIGAVLTVGDPRAFAFLEDVMRWSESGRSQAASAIGALGRSPVAALNISLGMYLRDLLDPSDPTTCRAAVLALAELGYEPALPDLIDLLEPSVGPHLRESALLSLRRFSKLSLPADPAAWRLWHAEELAWLERDAAACFRRLHADSAAARIDALRDLSRHRLGRSIVVERILPLLDASEPEVVVMACRTLDELDGVEAVPALVDVLDRTDAGVSAAAHQALLSLTGMQLPAESLAWAAALPTGAL